MKFKFEHEKNKMIDQLYNDWSRLGMRLTNSGTTMEVNPEKAIVNTTHAGRFNSRLLFSMLTWIRDNADLINSQKLVNLLVDADTSVLGAILTISLKNGADKKLVTIKKHCKKKGEPEILFTNMKKNPLFYEQEISNTYKEWEEWGLYCSEIHFYNDARYNREYILKNNKLLAIRALFGSNLRAEILYMLFKKSNLYIRLLSKM
ncbi:MAG: hypothetical protein PVI26_08355, partial [Chitinispirillia bacterium]